MFNSNESWLSICTNRNKRVLGIDNTFILRIDLKTFFWKCTNLLDTDIDMNNFLFKRFF